MDLLLHSPTALYALTLILGLIIGSFLNVVIYRLPLMLEHSWRGECADLLGLEHPTAESLGLAYPGSRCPQCGHPIRPWENIPVLSWLLLRGRCSACAAPIGLRYPLTELAAALLALVVVGHFGPTWKAAAALPFTWTLLTLGLIDLDTRLLPDVITLPLLWLGLLASLTGLFTDPRAAILGAALGYLALWGVFHLFRLATGKEGMGYGDFKLLAVLGAWLGWQHLPQIIVLSAFVGATVGILLILSRQHHRDVPIPFGPYLAAAGWISLLWGDPINHAYLLWSGFG